MDVREVLVSVPLFANALDQSGIDQLVEVARVVEFDKGATIIREHEPGTSMYIIRRGSVSVTTTDGTGKSKVANLSQGQIFGEMSLFTGLPRLATVVADDHAELVEITKSMMRDLLASSPKLVGRFASLLQKRQGDLDQIVTDPEFWQRHGQSGENLARIMQRNFDIAD